MEFSRRNFLKTGGLLLSANWLSALGPSSALAAPFAKSLFPEALPILQTATNETTTQFKILNPAAKHFAYRITARGGKELQPRILDRFIHPAWPDQAMDHVLVDGLELGTEYKLQVVDADTGLVQDERSFNALDRSLARGRAAMISCTCDDFKTEQTQMWKAVADDNPDVIFFIGDATYLDGRQSDDERGMWRRHLEVRQALDVFKWQRLRPVISVWDDHDFGINDGDSSFPLKEATRQMFEAMFGSAPIEGFTKGPSLALESKLFGQRYYLMDDRFYRTHEGGGSHWGEEQEEWLFSRLSASVEPSILMNGSQYFGGYAPYESFERQHPEQFRRVLSRLKTQEAPVVLISGDRHFSELMRIEPQLLGYETLELTSSSLHSYAPDKVPSSVNPRRFEATNQFNFLSLESSNRETGFEVAVRCVGSGSKVYFEHSQTIKR